MKDPKALKLFQEVLAKTRAGRIQWEPTASETEFFSVLPSGHTILVSVWEDKNTFTVGSETTLLGAAPEKYVLILRRGEQELMRVTQYVEGVDSAGLSELYAGARRTALQVDASVDEALSVLEKL